MKLQQDLETQFVHPDAPRKQAKLNKKAMVLLALGVAVVGIVGINSYTSQVTYGTYAPAYHSTVTDELILADVDATESETTEYDISS